MVLQETVDTIAGLYGESLKRITIERIVIGAFLTGVKLSNGCGGISYTPASEMHQDLCCAIPSLLKQKPLRLKGMTFYEVLNSLSDAPMFNTLKIVVLNALSVLFLTWNRYFIIEDSDAMDCINFDTAKKVGMVGVSPPFLEMFKRFGYIQLNVIERRKESLTGDDVRFFVPAEYAQVIIPQCDTVIVMDSAIANGTMDEYLSYVKPESTVIVTGLATSFLPDAFFKRNVGVVSGVSVTRPDKALDMLAEGMDLYHLFSAGTGILKKINVLCRESGTEHGYGAAAVGG
jgi:uncharacterized protein (DUF4213/DUF364 family)